MTQEEKIKIFNLELSYIKNPDIKNFTEQMIGRLPNYFFEVPASSTGKYHPQYALGDGGLVRHTKAAVRIAIELFRCHTVTGKFSEDKQDEILAALILHDGCKSGIEKQTYTVTEHPLEVVKFCNQQTDIKSQLDENKFQNIMDNIATHMGEWTFDFKTKRKVLEEPKTGAQTFVHMCDYLASRKCLEFNFDAPMSN